MSASPESATQPPGTSIEDISFSSTSQLESAQPGANPGDNSQCSHFKSISANETINAKILAKYKAVVSWSVNRTQDVLRPAKRRRVSVLLAFACMILT